MNIINTTTQTTAPLTEDIIFKQGCGAIGTGSEDKQRYFIGIDIPECFKQQSPLYTLLRNVSMEFLQIPSAFADIVIFSNDFGISIDIEVKNGQTSYLLFIGGVVNGYKIEKSFDCTLSPVEEFLITRYIDKINIAVQKGKYTVQHAS